MKPERRQDTPVPSGRDITEQVRAAWLAAIVSSSEDAIIGKTLDGTITSWNAGAEAMYGYTAAEITGHSIAELIPPDRPDELPEILAQLARGQRIDHFQTRRVRKDGTLIDVSVSVSPVRDADGQVTGFATVARDITEQVRAVKASSLLAAVVESSQDAIIGKTPGGTITSWNAGAEAMYGYTAAEITGHSIAQLIPPDRPDELPEILATLARGQRIERFQTRRVRKDGTVIDVSVEVSPVRDADGQVTSFATVARDITDQVRAADQIRAYQEQANRAQRLETVGQLAAGVAHDFNNSLSAIAGFADLITFGEDPGEAIDDAKQILSAVDRASRLTRSLLLIGRRAITRPQRADLNTVITGTRELLRASLGPAITLVVNLAAAPPAVWADPGQLEQAILNLAINARDAMPDGGTLTVTTAGARLEGTHAGHYAELIVSDTGTGMTPEVAARAFEPFYSTKKPGAGTGLGLSTIDGIITQAGGTITLTSKPGAGTTFRILIPAAAGIPAQASAQPQSAETQTAGPPPAGTILITDDEPTILRNTARILQLNGYTPLEAANGFQALEILAGNDVHLLLTDFLMPGMTGTELADRARQLSPGLLVLHMSGYTPPGDLARQPTFIHKPFTAGQLLAKIRALLQPQPQP